MKTKTQLAFPLLKPYLRLEHGGDIRKSQRKLVRPFDPKRPLHLVMRSTRAKSSWNLLHPRNSRVVKSLVYGIARRYGVKIYQFANSGNHIHALVHAKNKISFQNFLRVLAGKIAQWITGARKGFAIGKFWDSLAYSRILTWGREFLRVRYYVIQNELEGLGVLGARSDSESHRILSRD